MTTQHSFLPPLATRVALIGLAVFLAPALRAVETSGAHRFGSPDEAVKALVAAAKAGDRAGVDAIFGPGVKDLLSGDEKQDAIEFAAFAKSLGQYARLVKKADDRYVINIGAQNWPMPIPLVRAADTWFFDTAAGKEEVLSRRIGKDEITAIGVCRAYVVAQREYASEDRDGSGVLRYAEKLRSTPGEKDGLYWRASSDEEQSPFGPLVAEARAEGYGRTTAEGEPQPFHGYLFKILTAQGAAAPGGAYDYVINGNMVAGFALVAYPAHWGESGIMTFIVNQSGKVYECNFGAESAEIALAMSSFNPEAGWTPVDVP
jgi:stage V sporulation protein SpoVS